MSCRLPSSFSRPELVFEIIVSTHPQMTVCERCADGLAASAALSCPGIRQNADHRRNALKSLHAVSFLTLARAKGGDNREVVAGARTPRLVSSTDSGPRSPDRHPARNRVALVWGSAEIRSRSEFA
ncbi:MAG: hypothetical protein JWN96_1693 [Mycobacterium sp.]|nr:hypothetical protein [Mycobacterium sp.]